MTAIVQTFRRLKKASIVYFDFGTGPREIIGLLYYQPDRCICFICDGQSFKVFPSQIHKFSSKPKCAVRVDELSINPLVRKLST